MPRSESVNWLPISEMPLIASMIDEALEDTRAQIKTLTEASTRPHVMDDATVDRIDRVYAEQMEFVDIYAEQIVRWRTESRSVHQTNELDRMEETNRELREATTIVLALSRELRRGTIDRVMERSDIELGLEAVLRGRPATRRWDDAFRRFEDIGAGVERDQQARDGSFGDFAQEGLQLGIGLFDWVHVGAVRRQISQFGSGGLYELLDPGSLVARQIVHDDDVAFREGGSQTLFHPFLERGRVDRPVEGLLRHEAAKAQAGDERDRLVMAVRNGGA